MRMSGRPGRTAALSAGAVSALVMATVAAWRMMGPGADPSREAALVSQAEGDDPAPVAPAPLGSAESGAVPGLRVEVMEVARVSAAIVEVRLALVNRSETAALQVGTRLADPGDDPGSLSGAFLTARGGAVRYYVLRDAQGRPACSTGLETIEARGRVPAWIRFPAPSDDAASVTLHLGEDLVVEGLPIAPASALEEGPGR